MTIKLYELAADNADIRFSPHCWKTRLALAHKGLDVERIPWRFTDKDAIAFSGQGKVPVLLDGETSVHDSWTIACYLEDTYPDLPTLFGGEAARAQCRFVNAWADTVILPNLAPMIICDIHANIATQDKDYFRKTREARFGNTLEALSANRDKDVVRFRTLFAPVRTVLAGQPYLGGDQPLYADYCVFGMLMWARCISDIDLLPNDDPIHAWCEKLLDMFDGMPRKAACAA
jgi:glutathione S-transferase